MSLKNLLLNNAYQFGAASLLRQRKKNKLTVLSIHRISDEHNTFWNPIAPASFDKLLSYTKKHYHVIGFNDLPSPSSSKKPLLILSFDDGYYDFYEFALPLLKKHGLPCNHNIVNDCANSGTSIWTQRLNVIFEHCLQHSIPLKIELKNTQFTLKKSNNNWMVFYLSVFKMMLLESKVVRNELLDGLENEISINTSCRMMNWDEIRECASNGVEIGNHTYHHDVISTITDKEILNKEILGAKQETERELSRKVNVLALPNGQTGALADEIISQSKHEFVLYVDEQLNSLPIQVEPNSPLKISRINLVDEPFEQIALRTEQFHTVIRGNA